MDGGVGNLDAQKASRVHLFLSLVSLESLLDPFILILLNPGILRHAATNAPSTRSDGAAGGRRSLMGGNDFDFSAPRLSTTPSDFDESSRHLWIYERDFNQEQIIYVLNLLEALVEYAGVDVFHRRRVQPEAIEKLFHKVWKMFDARWWRGMSLVAFVSDSHAAGILSNPPSPPSHSAKNLRRGSFSFITKTFGEDHVNSQKDSASSTNSLKETARPKAATDCAVSGAVVGPTSLPFTSLQLLVTILLVFLQSEMKSGASALSLDGNERIQCASSRLLHLIHSKLFSHPRTTPRANCFPTTPLATHSPTKATTSKSFAAMWSLTLLQHLIIQKLYFALQYEAFQLQIELLPLLGTVLRGAAKVVGREGVRWEHDESNVDISFSDYCEGVDLKTVLVCALSCTRQTHLMAAFVDFLISFPPPAHHSVHLVEFMLQLMNSRDLFTFVCQSNIHELI